MANADANLIAAIYMTANFERSQLRPCNLHSLHLIRSQIDWEIDTVVVWQSSPHGHSSECLLRRAFMGIVPRPPFAVLQTLSSRTQAS